MTGRTGPADSEATRKPRRSTQQKSAISAELSTLGGFVSAQELHRLLNASGSRIGVATVYRQLNRLADDGEIDTVTSPDGERLFRSCHTAEHHHHIVCRQCGTAVEISPPVEQWLDDVGRSNGFTAISHTFEVFGICADCSTSAETS